MRKIRATLRERMLVEVIYELDLPDDVEGEDIELWVQDQISSGHIDPKEEEIKEYNPNYATMNLRLMDVDET